MCTHVSVLSFCEQISFPHGFGMLASGILGALSSHEDFKKPEISTMQTISSHLRR